MQSRFSIDFLAQNVLEISLGIFMYQLAAKIHRLP